MTGNKDQKAFNELDFIVNFMPARIFLLVVFAIAYFFVFDQKWDINGDNASYYVLGHALADGLGFVNPAFPGNPAENHFPIGFPLIIALFSKIGLGSIVALKVINGLFLLASGLLWFEIFKRIQSNVNLAIVGAMAIFLNPVLMRSGTILMSEIPFLFFISLGIFYFVKLDSEEDQKWFTQPGFWIMALSLGASFYIRSVALAVFAGIGFYLLAKKKFQPLIATVAGIAVFITPSFFLNTGGGNYFRQLIHVNPYNVDSPIIGMSDLMARMKQNALAYLIGFLPDATLPIIGKVHGISAATDVFISILLLYFIWKGIKNAGGYKWFLVAYLGSALLIILVWPSVWASSRFMAHVIPVTSLLTLMGLHQLSLKWESKFKVKKPLGVYPVFLLVMFNLIVLNTQRIQAKAKYRPEWQNYFKTAHWAKVHSEKDAIICARKPVFFYLESDRKCVNFKNTSDTKALVQDFADKKVNYVVLDMLGFGNTEKYLFPALEQYKECFNNVAVYEKPNTYLLQFNADQFTNPNYQNQIKSNTTPTEDDSKNELEKLLENELNNSKPDSSK